MSTIDLTYGILPKVRRNLKLQCLGYFIFMELLLTTNQKMSNSHHSLVNPPQHPGLWVRILIVSL